jgi:hypothetical protein
LFQELQIGTRLLVKFRAFLDELPEFRSQARRHVPRLEYTMPLPIQFLPDQIGQPSSFLLDHDIGNRLEDVSQLNIQG